MSGPSGLKRVYFAAMFVVACSGFPVPVSRYWQEFDAVEISDTEIAIPGAGTVRRWIREAPEQWFWVHKRWKVHEDPRGWKVPEELARKLGVELPAE